MPYGQTTHAGSEPIARVLHDEGLTELLRIHLARPGASGSEPDSAGRMVPALQSAYLELEAIRHDFPLVLLDGGADPPVRSLARIIDALLDELEPSTARSQPLRRDVYRLETRIKRLAGRRRSGRLTELWALAADDLVGASAQPEEVRARIDAATGALQLDGRLIGCGLDTVRLVFEHAWAPLQAERAQAERVALDDLIARVSEVLESERARSPGSTSPQALEAALGGEHSGGIDFEALSAVLRCAQHHRAVPAKRLKRLRAARKALMAERAQLRLSQGNGGRLPRRAGGAGICHGCSEACEQLEAALQRRVDLLRAVRTVTLELENRYREERHDPFFERFSREQLESDDYRALPPLLVFLSGDTLDEAEKSRLIDLLGSEIPFKVVLELADVPGGECASAPPGTFADWGRQIARMALSLGDVFVMQTAASHLPDLMTDVVAGLRHPGPALFCVYTGSRDSRIAVPRYLRCAGAVESRVLPSFVFDPGGGADLASRLTLRGSPQVDRDWCEHPFSYEGAGGREVNENLAFTCVDFLMLDPRFARHFVVVPPARWHANMVPVARYLELSPRQALDKVPFVHLVDAEDRVQRVVVRRALMPFARKCLATWRELQELAGIRDSRTQRLLEEQRARLEEEHRRAMATPEAGGADRATAQAPDATPAPAELQPPAQAQVPGPAPSPGPGEAYIETELCTSCDDCIARNPAMFAYNEAKQAYLKDATAGSYRDLVEAAENCPVCIIHPGQPLNPQEAGLEDLAKRAAAFQ